MTEIFDAATVVIMRPGSTPVEIFMLRRHQDHDFMANAWVFPGGRVETRDRQCADQDRLCDLAPATARRRLGDVDAATAHALYIAALRETFEESGLLFTRHRDTDQPLKFSRERPREHFAKCRRDVDRGQLDLAQLCEREALILDADRLAYLAHWITPDFESRRYDTRFFAALSPPDQVPSHDDGETICGDWWTPSAAIDAYRDEQILLAPPTLRILEQLREFDAPHQAMAAIRQRPIPPTILPHPTSTDRGELTLLLPGDPDYPTDHPDLERATPIGDGVTRMIRRDGQWFSVR